LRRCQVEMEKCTREHDALNSKIEELELYDDSSQRELKSLIKEKQDAMVENNILKLQVKRVRDSLYHTADNVHDLKHRCLRLTTALKERKVEIQQNMNKITQEVKHADEIKSQLNMEVHNRVSKIDKLKKTLRDYNTFNEGARGRRRAFSSLPRDKSCSRKRKSSAQW